MIDELHWNVLDIKCYIGYQTLCQISHSMSYMAGSISWEEHSAVRFGMRRASDASLSRVC